MIQSYVLGVCVCYKAASVSLPRGGANLNWPLLVQKHFCEHHSQAHT